MNRYILFFFLILSTLTTLRAQQSRLVEVGNGYSQTSVNTTVFRNNSLVTQGDEQYISYYDGDGYLVTGVQVQKKQKDGSVTGSDGKTYYPYLRTGWTAQGKPRLAHQPSELEEMLQDLDTAQTTE